jgi:sugar (pentulose or hexulose) kinase
MRRVPCCVFRFTQRATRHMDNMLFLGIDAGTTSLKAGLFDERGNARALVNEEYSLVTPVADQAEIDPEEYWRACVNAVRRALSKANAPRDEIVGIGVSSQGETTIAVDANGRALRRALVWLDNRASDQARQIAERFDLKSVYEITGDPEIVPTWTACKILWLKQNEPEVFQSAHKFILVEDFLLHRLTGRFATDGAVACTSMLWDIRRGTWWNEMLDFIGITPAKLSEPVLPGEIVGTLTRDAAEALGLSPRVRVVGCGMDQAAGAVGAGNLHPGVISETTGAALAIQATIPAPNLDPTGRLPVYVHAVRDAFLFVPVCNTGGMALRWFRDQFAQEEMRAAREQNRDAYDLLGELAQTIEPGCEGLTMLPHLAGAFSPEYNLEARGVFYGFTLRHTKAHFVRAIMESIAFMLKRNLDVMQSLGVNVREVRSTGGGAKSPLWLQIKADVLGVPVMTLEQEDTAVLGDAILASVACGAHKNLDAACVAMVRLRGRIEPTIATRARYDEAFARYLAVYERLFGV